jgi:hypothetical protein
MPTLRRGETVDDGEQAVCENRGSKSRRSNSKIKRILVGIVDFTEVRHSLTSPLRPATAATTQQQQHPSPTSTTHPRLVKFAFWMC